MTLTIGFTGTRSLVGDREHARVRSVVDALPDGTRVVTGACIGVDIYVARRAFLRDIIVHTIVPADRSRVGKDWQRYVDTFHEMPEGTSYRDRNARIVAESDRLIAFPDHAEDDPQSRRSGTWQTIRMARKVGKPVEVHILCEHCLERRTKRPTGGQDA